MRNNFFTDIVLHNGEGIGKFALSIVLLIGFIVTTTSCKEECVDICQDFALVLDESDCSCVCPEKQTPINFNGYVYCIEESKTQDIYILEDLNVSSILLKDDIQTPIPEVMLSHIPKQLDTMESFFIWDPQDARFYISFELNVWKSLPSSRYLEYITPFWITKFNNIQSPEIIFPLVNGNFRDMIGMLDGNLFPAKKNGLGIIQFSDNMDQMFFHYFGYNHFNDMFDSFDNLTTEEVFQFPYIPQETSRDPYDPHYMKLTFSRLNFD